MTLSDEYRDLVDTPNETLEVEYKSWLDLSDNETRADLARHIAAIANYGGGMIIFGFNDSDLQYAGPNTHPIVVNRDEISGIVKKYLEPTFHCDVEVVQSALGNDHPVIRVPSHGATPICAKRGGPVVSGSPQGITKDVYYIRKVGPASEPILTATEWAPVIRRCALHDRAAILSAIQVAISGQQPQPVAQNPSELQQWHDAAFAQYKADILAVGAPQELARRHVQFSYSILRADGQRLNPAELRDPLLLQINNEVRDRVQSGWSMMYPFTRPGIAPQFTVDAASGEGNEDFIQCSLVRDPAGLDHSADLWRVSPAGKATLIRPYWEDSPRMKTHTGLSPGTWLSPNYQVQLVAELVRHAQAFSEKFDASMTVTFLCEWRGLTGRTLYSPEAYYSIGGSASTDTRKTALEVPVASLGNSWSDIVAQLTAPMIRIFNSSFQVTAGWISGQAPKWLTR